MANKTGAKWTKGGALSRKRTLDIDFSGIGELTEKLDNLGADLKKVLGDAMEKASAEVQQDTLKALADTHLPAKGKYHGKARETEASVVRDVKVSWSGNTGEVNLGFDKTKQGAGGWLITGTPKMQPDRELEKIYSGKTSRSYEKRIKKKMMAELNNEIEKRLK